MIYHFQTKTKWLFILAALLIFKLSLYAQQKTDYNVAIFLYQGVELLDFAGPGEVFSAARGFHVYTVTVDGNEILSQGFVTVKPVSYTHLTLPTILRV